jgi:hypothetical protein
VNFDTSERTRAGQYKLTDEAYAALLGKLADTHFDHVNPALRDNILQFYDNLNAPIETRRHKDKWERLQRQLTQLKDSTNANGTSGEPK